MLRLPKSLLFPALKKIADVQFKHQPSSQRTNLYKLDWSKVEEIKYVQWKEQFPINPPPVSFPKTLPDELITLTDNMEFALSEEYLQEIRHCSKKAAEEWDRKRPKQGIDPAIKPTISYVDTSFHLLADCLYDANTNYYSRSGNKLITPYILSQRFWTHQTPYYNAIQWVNLPELEKLLESLKTKDPETYTTGMGIYENLLNHFNILKEKHYKPKIEEVKPAFNSNIKDFLQNKVSDLFCNKIWVKIPEINKTFYTIQGKFKKAKGKITLQVEPIHFNALYIREEIETPVDLYLDIETQTLCAKGALVKSISATPPEITFVFNNLFIVARDNTVVEKEVKKIDLKKIKDLTDSEIKELDNI